MRQKILRKHNADSVHKLNIDLNFFDKAFNYTLLPLYIANYNYNDKTYNFYINGVSGKIVGKYPKSRFKIFLLILGAGLLAAAAIALFWYFK
jgi:hypothetical protein